MERKKLIDCCQFISDGDHLPPPKSQKGVPFITISNFTERNKICFNDTLYVPEEYYNSLGNIKKAQKGDILYSVVGSFGKPIFVDFDTRFVFQRHIAILRPNENINGKFLYYLMLNSQFYKLMDKLAIGCSQKTITLDTLRNVEIDLPPKWIQNKIVSVISLIDAKINTNCLVNDNLEQQLRTIYDYWFTQFDFPDENGNPYRSSGGKMVWNDELKREIPEGWSVKKLSEILNVITGKEDANFATQNGKYKFFTCSNTTLLCDEFSFNGKAVLIAGNGDFNVKHYSGKFNAYQRTYVLMPQEILLRAPIYLVAKQMINKFTNGSNGSIVKFITKGDIENIPILIPNNMHLYKVLNDLLDCIEANQQTIDSLLKLRDWLLPMLMNGQATVAD